MMFEDVLWKIKWWLMERGLWRGEGSAGARDAYRLNKAIKRNPFEGLRELRRQVERDAAKNDSDWNDPLLPLVREVEPCGTMLETMWNQLTPADRDLVRKMLRDNPGMTDMEAIAKVRDWNQ